MSQSRRTSKIFTKSQSQWKLVTFVGRVVVEAVIECGPMKRWSLGSKSLTKPMMVVVKESLM